MKKATGGADLVNVDLKFKELDKKEFEVLATAIAKINKMKAKRLKGKK